MTKECGLGGKIKGKTKENVQMGQLFLTQQGADESDP